MISPFFSHSPPRLWGFVSLFLPSSLMGLHSFSLFSFLYLPFLFCGFASFLAPGLAAGMAFPKGLVWESSGNLILLFLSFFLHRLLTLPRRDLSFVCLVLATGWLMVMVMVVGGLGRATI